MADNKGTKNAKEGCSKWFIMEAACSDIETDLEKLFEDSTDSDISDLIDDENVEQGNSREPVSYTHLTLPTNREV